MHCFQQGDCQDLQSAATKTWKHLPMEFMKAFALALWSFNTRVKPWARKKHKLPTTNLTLLKIIPGWFLLGLETLSPNDVWQCCRGSFLWGASFSYRDHGRFSQKIMDIMDLFCEIFHFLHKKMGILVVQILSIFFCTTPPLSPHWRRRAGPPAAPPWRRHPRKPGSFGCPVTKMVKLWLR